ncbi:aminoglycoside phosphotransferase family protein [Endozoicomonas ascidiicola]|uniref:aminoglycoside phosphotransferase family protein n=1 Tax=Endozoicomonas ascidiicola TaxID=1698521 RepID=UPI000ADAAC6C|nr:phosphotransferase [Endozoicomonas ascidiicola]
MATKISSSRQSHSESLRREQLTRWVTSVLASNEKPFLADKKPTVFFDAPMVPPNGEHLPLRPIGSDAGFRKYYRLQTPHQTIVAVDAPPETEDTRAFVKIDRCWKKGGINVPEVYAVDYDHGFMLQEDFGDEPLQSLLHGGAEDQFYPQLLDILLTIQQQPVDILPPYDETLIRFELSLYPQWFLGELLGLDTQNAELKEQLSSLFDELTLAFTSQPQGTVHRDYHSRNLMLTPENTVGVIDFQGALNGPLLYDAVSLLKDCYVCWPEDKTHQWLKGFVEKHPELSSVDEHQIITWFDLTGLQRHLKCLGIFSRLCLRDKKPDYLNNLPGTLNYVLDCCRKYPQLQRHGIWLENNVKPILQEQMGRLSEGVDI